MHTRSDYLECLVMQILMRKSTYEINSCFAAKHELKKTTPKRGHPSTVDLLMKSEEAHKSHHLSLVFIP
jgi:hypothetical protein